MKTKYVKIISAFLALLMCAGMLPLSALAASEDYSSEEALSNEASSLSESDVNVSAESGLDYTEYNVEDTIESADYTVYELGASSSTAFSYDVPTDGVTVLVFLRGNGACGYSNNLISALLKSKYISNDSINLVFAESAGNTEETFQSFLDTYASGYSDATNLTLYYGASSIMSRYCGLTIDSGSITYPIVVFVTETSGTKYIRYALSGNDSIIGFDSIIDYLLNGTVSDNKLVDVTVIGTELYDYANEVFEILNEERETEGLSALTLNKTLTEYAMQRAAECSIYYSHTRPDGNTCFAIIDSSVYKTSTTGENIAVGYVSAENVMTGWMNSEGHRANILNSGYTEVGIGCFYSNGTLYWVQLFGNSSTNTEESTYEGSVYVSATVSAYTNFLDTGVAMSSDTYSCYSNGTISINTEQTATVYLTNTNSGWSAGSALLYPSADNVVDDTSGDVIATVSVDSNGAVTVTPVATGTGTIKLKAYEDDSSPATVTLNISLPTRTVTFNSNGGSSVSSQTVSYGSTATEPTAPTRAGYTFAGWYTAASGGSKYSFSAAVTSNITLYAHWTINSYTVTFNSNGGSSVSSQTVTYGSTATEPTSPTRTGYTFAGWYTAASGGYKYSFPLTVTADITLYAHWTANTYTIKFDSNGGNSFYSTTLSYGSTVNEPTTPYRAGYTFVGWYTAASGGTKCSFPLTVTADITLYAHWTANTCTVTFDSNGGSSVSSQTVSYGSSATEPTAPTRTGYTFAGWYTAASGGSKYSFPLTVTADITLYAHWTANTYTVTFNSNGGTSVSSQTVNYGSAATEPTEPTRYGYTFDGWYTAASGGSKYSFSTTVTANVTLYAHWTAIYKDVSEGQWFYESVMWAYYEGVMTGTGTRQFDPNESTTRAQLVTVLYRMVGSPTVMGSSTFTDLNITYGQWYIPAVTWAQKNSIVNGTSATTFSPDDDVTREQIATILWRYVGEPSSSQSLGSFSDSGKIDDYAKTAMAWAVENGIFKGDDNGLLNPLKSATRAEIATILQRFCEKFGG